MDSAQMDSSEEVRNWAELQPDVLSLIFQKLGSIEVLFTAQGVCSSWMRISYEPLLWRHVDMRNPRSLLDSEYDLKKMARSAVDRSCGQCVEFSVEHFGTDDLLQYVIDNVSALRSLHLISCDDISDEKLIEVAKKFPQLEELEISYCSFLKDVLENVGQLCPQLKHLRLNCRGWITGIECDEEAVAIARNMPELRRLQLFGNSLTDDGLRFILDGCPHLASLDLRQCFRVILAGSLRNSCMDKIRDLRLPNDSTSDYEFDSEIGNAFYDEDYPPGFSEIDLLYEEYYDDEYYDDSDVDFDFFGFED